MMDEQIREVLGELGYVLYDSGEYFRTSALYRGGDNKTIISINKENGGWVDFKTNERGTLNDLVRLTLKTSSEEAKKYLEGKIDQVRIFEKQKPKTKIEGPKILDPKIIQGLVKDHTYWVNRGVRKETLELFQGGVCQAGEMKNRYVFPIFNYKKQLVGVSGRYLYNIKEGARIPKWKHKGNTQYWRYPLQQNIEIIKKLKKIIIVEGIGDMLGLWEAGIKNVIVAFGTRIHFPLINILLTLDPDEVIISFDDDSLKSNAGNNAASKEYKKLLKYFDPDQVRVCLPDSENDFGDMTKQQIEGWIKKNNV